MKVLEICTNYFNGFQDIACFKKNDAKINTLAILEIISYFTVVIPLFFTVLFTAASLNGRASKIQSLSPQDLTINNQARKTITKKNKSKVTPQEILDIESLYTRDLTLSNQARKAITKNNKSKITPQEIRGAAQKAAEGKLIYIGGPGGYSYEKLLDMVKKASLEEIPYVIEGALNEKYSTGFEKALGELLRRRELDKSDFDKEKLKLTIHTITEEKLLKLIDKKKLPSLTENFEYRINFEFYNNMELELLYKFGKELLLSAEGIEKIRNYIDHLKALCEKTRDKPRFMYE